MKGEKKWTEREGEIKEKGKNNKEKKGRKKKRWKGKERERWKGKMKGKEGKER